MGLLTNANAEDANKIVALVRKYTGRISILSYIVGIVWLGFLTNSQYNLGTYFSENALLPGLVVENFYDGQKAETFYQSLSAKEGEGLGNEDFMEGFKQIGLFEVELQNFTVIDPVTKMESVGSNVYAVLRAKRSSGTESLILNVPFFPTNPKGRQNVAGIALMLAVAEYFASQVYWAKDIVFIIAEGHVGSLAWVRGHQEISAANEYLIADRVRNKAGNIQAAVNFILESNRVCSLSTKFHGINGQLPNLDLVNLVNKFVVLEWEKRPDWTSDLWKLVNYMKIQATGTTTGSHGFFLKYGIESVTLYGSKGGRNCKHHYSFGDMGRFLEATFRSLNNLLERLHQSFFFYLKTTPNRFISIGLYFPPLALIIFPILLKGASVWLTFKNMEAKKSLFLLIAFHSLAVGFRWIVSNIQVASFGTLASLTPESLKIVVLVLSVLLFGVIRTSVSVYEKNITDCLYCFSLLQLATSLYCLALFNPSLIVMIGVVFSPLLTIFFFFDAGRRKWLSGILVAVLVGLISYFYTSLDVIIAKYFYESEMFGNFIFDFSILSALPAVCVWLSVA